MKKVVPDLPKSRETRRIDLHDNLHGKIIGCVVAGKHDFLWGQVCAVCNQQFWTGNVVISITRYMEHEALYLCGKCIAATYEQMPPDSSDERVRRVAAESTLADWINDADASMTDAL